MLILLPIINVSCLSVFGFFMCVCVPVCGFIIYVSSVSLCGYDHMSAGVSRGQEIGVSLEFLLQVIVSHIM